jgi:hypothetical protein
VAYRDDHEALVLQVATLEREKERLEQELAHEREERRVLAEQRHGERRTEARSGCVACSGTLLPVAVFAGHDIAAPLPLSMSTIRFGRPEGGFTHSAPVHSLVCTSCGLLHNFIAMDAVRLSPDDDLP